jgi:hypothetical protein
MLRRPSPKRFSTSSTVAEFQEVLGKDVAEFNRMVAASGIPPAAPAPKLEP